MAALREAFTNADTQANFFSDQQIRYQKVEPNRFLPQQLATKLGVDRVNSALTNFDKYDPYTETVSNPLDAAALDELMYGQKSTTAEEAECRAYSGVNGLVRLRADQRGAETTPIRCGWIYTQSPDATTPATGRGALGTIRGPLNTKEDVLTTNSRWFWNLDKAYNAHFTADSRAVVDGTSLAAIQSQYSNAAFCRTTQRTILLDSAGNPSSSTPCPADAIVTNANNVGTVGGNTQLGQQLRSNLTTLQQCRDPGANNYLTRECLLLAVKQNGCASEGTLYQSLQGSRPTDTQWDTVLQRQPSFQAYQSRQGANALTDTLFQRNQSTWQQAENDIAKLSQFTATATDPYVKIAAEDLCLQAGKFNDYDFCSEITDSTALSTVELKCLQAHWQEMNGKPAGLLYPKRLPVSTEFAALNNGTMTTFGNFKAAVNKLRETIAQTGDPVLQRKALDNFYGVRVSGAPFTPLNLASIDAGFQLGTNPLVFWIDAKDPGSLTIDGQNRVVSMRDKSGRGSTISQPTISSRPTYTTAAFPGLRFDGAQALPIAPATNFVTGTSFTVFIAEKRSTANQENYILGGSDTNTNTNLVVGYRFNTMGTMDFWGNGFNFTVPAFNSGLEPTRIWSIQKTASGRQVFVNGTQLGSDVNVSNIVSWNNPTIGRTANALFYRGTVYEVLMFNPGLSPDFRQKVEGYMAHRWGVAADLPASHPFRASAP
jgi:hypothetical protein